MRKAGWSAAGAVVVLALLGCRGAPSHLFGVSASTPKTAEGAVDVPALIHQRCTWCHSSWRIENNHFARADWEKTVTRMVGKGARLDDAERQAVIDFLAARDAALVKPAGT